MTILSSYRAMYAGDPEIPPATPPEQPTEVPVESLRRNLNRRHRPKCHRVHDLRYHQGAIR
jgi:hypothetical protein